MADSQWKHGRLTQVLRRTTRGVLLSVGAVTVAGVVGSTILSRQAAKAKLKLPEDFVLVMDFEGSNIVEKSNTDPLAKLRSDGKDLQLSKMVNALKCAGTDTRVQGLVGCFGDAQQYVAMAQVQELRSSILGFRRAKADTVPTVAYADSFGEAGGSGTVAYYLASAFDQLYVHETGLVSFTGFAASTPFLRGLLDRWHIKPLAFAREEYKSVVSQFTDKAYSKANREATQAWLNGWMGQIVQDTAAARGLHPAQVVRALHASPLSADEAAAAGLITAPSHRSTATRTLLHSRSSAANPATLIANQAVKPTNSKAAKKVCSEVAGAGSETRTTPGSPAAAVSVQMAVHSAAEGQNSRKRHAATQSSAAEVSSEAGRQAVQLAEVQQQDSAVSTQQQDLGVQVPNAKSAAQSSQTSLVERIRSAQKLLNHVSVVQIAPDELSLRSCPAVPLSKYIQVLEHEKSKNADKPGFMQAMWAAVTTTEDQEEADFASGSAAAGKTRPQVAVITASGQISAGSATPSPLRKQVQITSTELGLELQKARHDPKVKAVVLRVDSPGGSAVGSDAIYQEVMKVRRAGKPVVVSMGNLAASGGYYISAGANKIVAQPGTITGSIGVAFGKFNVSQALRDQGISVDTIAVGRNATSSSIFHDFTKDQQRQVNTKIDRTYAQFLSRVAAGRGMSMGEARKVAKGRIWTGEDALHHGLVDKLGGLADAVHMAKQEAGLPLEDKAVDVVDFPPPKSVFQLLKEALGGQQGGFAATSSASTLQNDGLLPLWWLALAKQLGLAQVPLMSTILCGDNGAMMMQHGTTVSGLAAYVDQQRGLQMLCEPVIVR